MKKILLEGPILSRSGYGEHARLVHRSIKDLEDTQVFINPLQWGKTSWDFPDRDVMRGINLLAKYVQDSATHQREASFDMQIHIGIPNEFEKKAPYSVCVTAGIETDRVAPKWLIKTHQGIDRIVVPSQHAKDGFIETKYEVSNSETKTRTVLNCGCPVEVVNYPVKEIEPEDIVLNLETDFNFLSIALLGPRKNIDFMIKGFVDEFRDNPDVGLILKTSTSKSSIIDRHKTKKSVEGFVKSLGPKKCKIYLLHGNLSESEMHSLYKNPKIKSYVSTTHGEGYGLPIFEAAYSGLPIIATDWSGHLDFLSGQVKGKKKKLFARVSHKLSKVQKEAVWQDIITEESRWAFPILKSYKEQLQKMYSNHGMYQSWAKKLQKEIRENFSEEKIETQMRAALGLEGATEMDKEIEDMFASLSK